jgi:hypothetical protein
MAKIKLINILKEAKIIPAGSASELASYVLHDGQGEFYQTKRGIEIMRSILDDYNNNHTNDTNSYADINDEDDIEEIINHPLYKSFVREAYIASSILKPFFERYPQADFYSGNDMEKIEDVLIVGPSVLNFNMDEEEYDEMIDTLHTNSGIKFADIPDEIEIFLALIRD